MDLYPPLPDFQLQFGQSCTLPFVEPSKCGLLGLEQDILLTDSTYCGKVVHKARMIMHIDDIERVSVTGISFVTHFEGQSLHSDHLEQLAIACPNL